MLIMAHTSHKIDLSIHLIFRFCNTKMPTLGITGKLAYAKIVSERINSLQCYELTTSSSHLPLMLALPLIYAVHPWSVQFECSMRHIEECIFNCLYNQDTY